VPVAELLPVAELVPVAELLPGGRPGAWPFFLLRNFLKQKISA
jgi:hypothetical protein